MRYWLVQDGANSVDVTPNSRQLIVRSSRKARIEPRDQLLILRRTTYPHVFTHIAKVQNVTFEEVEKEDGPFVITKVTVDEWRALEQQASVEMLLYSLTIIRNFERPDLHFRKGYRRLPEDDFQTIKTGEPFVARTTYFELLGALPASTRRSFEIERSPRDIDQWEDRSFADRANLLYGFIRERVIAAGSLVIALADIIGDLELSSENGEPLSHRLSEEGSLRTDDISIQASAFRDLNGSLRGGPGIGEDHTDLDVVEAALREARSPDRRDIEQRFESIFRGRQ